MIAKYRQTILLWASLISTSLSSAFVFLECADASSTSSDENERQIENNLLIIHLRSAFTISHT